MKTINNQKNLRDDILQATLEEICEKNISGTRIRNIAERINISPGLIHYYFPSKKDLFLGLIDKIMLYFDKEHDSYLYDTNIKPYEKMMIMVNKQIEYITMRKEHIAIIDFWTQAITDSEIREKIKDMYMNWERQIRSIVDEGVETGEFSIINANLVPNILISLISGAAIQYLVNENVFDLHSHFNEIHKILLSLLHAD